MRSLEESGSSFRKMVDKAPFSRQCGDILTFFRYIRFQRHCSEASGTRHGDLNMYLQDA